MKHRGREPAAPRLSADERLFARATRRAKTRDEREAVANLVSGFKTQLTTAALALEEGDEPAAERFAARAAHYREGLTRIARGANPLEIHGAVTGSSVFSRSR